jgi:hypothetical protein
VDGDAAVLVAEDLAFARVDAHADADPERRHGGAQRPAAAHGPGRAVERSEEAVAGGVDLASPEDLELVVGHRVEP